MRRSIFMTGCFGLALALATAVARAEEEGGDSVRGARLYSENCARCHNARPPDELDDRRWPVVVSHMRVIAGLPGDQARDIEAFLRANNNPPRPPVGEARGEALSGEALVEQSGCRGCHVIGAGGGTLGPSLNSVFERRDEEWIRVQIRNPKVHNPTTVMPQFGFGRDQVDAIVEELREVQQREEGASSR